MHIHSIYMYIYNVSQGFDGGTLTDFIENQIGKNFRFGIFHNVFTKILGEDYLLVSSKYTCWHQNSYQYTSVIHT